MRKLFVALLLAIGAATLAIPAFAELGSTADIPGKLMNAQMAQE
jgi:hypothetical protein